MLVNRVADPDPGALVNKRKGRIRVGLNSTHFRNPACVAKCSFLVSLMQNSTTVMILFLRSQK